MAVPGSFPRYFCGPARRVRAGREAAGVGPARGVVHRSYTMFRERDAMTRRLLLAALLATVAACSQGDEQNDIATVAAAGTTIGIDTTGLNTSVKDRKSGVAGKRVSGRVEVVGPR